MNETRIDLIRHGEPDGGRIFRGHSIDDPLSEKGWQQMQAAIAGQQPWQQIISSPMQRCQAFAEQTAHHHAIPLAVVDDFREVGFGHWEGRTREQIMQSDPDEYRDFYHDPIRHRPAGAEPLEAFIDRVVSTYEGILEQHKGKHCLVVTHAGVIRAIIAHALKAPPYAMYKLKITNAGITRIRYGENGGVIESING